VTRFPHGRRHLTSDFLLIRQIAVDVLLKVIRDMRLDARRATDCNGRVMGARDTLSMLEYVIPEIVSRDRDEGQKCYGKHYVTLQEVVVPL
jgi:hypothetical protein